VGIYACTKFTVQGFTRGWSRELGATANGWEATLARSRKPKAIAQEGDSEQPITVGQFLDAIFWTATIQRTIEGYATAFLQNR